MKETIELKCRKCSINYERPLSHVKYYKKNKQVFFKWSLEFCDKCRKEREEEALQRLPDVLKALSRSKR